MSHYHLHQHARDNERGQGLVEYALILVLVAVVVIAILAALGPRVGNIFSSVVNALNNLQNNTPCSITMDASHGSAVFTVPGNILDQSALTNGDFYWDGTGNDRMKNTNVNGSPTLALFSSKSWRSIVAKAEGDCSPFPNM